MSTNSPLIKICANTSEADLRLAAEAGADFAGMIVNFPPSPRHVPLEKALQMNSPLPLVVVTVNLPLSELLEIHTQLKPYALQLHGDESPELISKLVAQNIRVWKAVSGADAWEIAQSAIAAGAEAVLVDSRAQGHQQTIYGGTGLRSDWELAKELIAQGYKVILAGGLNPDNVVQASQEVQPWMLDVVSGVEQSPGLKDATKVKAFVQALRK
ncbi:MAG: phosphoribosylanthranilate isomerase [Abditibacteriaceae bacterium]